MEGIFLKQCLPKVFYLFEPFIIRHKTLDVELLKGLGSPD